MNKSALTNVVAGILVVVGYLSQIDWLFVMAIFALSGALTNWLAIHMLFEKVPGLYGSGIIQIKFQQFKNAIRQLVMEQFFNQDNISRFMSESSGQAHHFDLSPIIKQTDLSPAFDSLVATIKQSSFGGMLSMFGGEQALEPMREPFTNNLSESLISITQSDQFAEQLRVTIASDATQNDTASKIKLLVQARLDELTPNMVKQLIQELIKSHLGYLVVWGGVFGGLIGLVAHFAGI